VAAYITVLFDFGFWILDFGLYLHLSDVCVAWHILEFILGPGVIVLSFS
jgi:hypothetical protein